jgi:hypothetical protein
MPEKEVCVKWVGDKCIEWAIVDGKLTATVNQKKCPTNVMKDVKKTLSEIDGFKIKFKE